MSASGRSLCHVGHDTSMTRLDSAHLTDRLPGTVLTSTLYTADPDEHLRFLAFTRAVFTCCQRCNGPPQFSLQRWHTALPRCFLKGRLRLDRFSPVRVPCYHSHIGYQGYLPPPASDPLPGAEELHASTDDCARTHQPIAPWNHLADAITTVSPTHAAKSAPTNTNGVQDFPARAARRARRNLNGATTTNGIPATHTCPNL